jgi:hypothetical protein
MRRNTSNKIWRRKRETQTFGQNITQIDATFHSSTNKRRSSSRSTQENRNYSLHWFESSQSLQFKKKTNTQLTNFRPNTLRSGLSKMQKQYYKWILTKDQSPLSKNRSVLMNGIIASLTRYCSRISLTLNIFKIIKWSWT